MESHSNGEFPKAVQIGNLNETFNQSWAKVKVKKVFFFHKLRQFSPIFSDFNNFAQV